jgi:protein-disulfide isomerase
VDIAVTAGVEELTPPARLARELGLDADLFAEKLRKRKYASRIARDVESADQSGVTGTPTFFANGRRHHGAFDLTSLTELVRSALSQSKGSAPTSSAGSAAGESTTGP